MLDLADPLGLAEHKLSQRKTASPTRARAQRNWAHALTRESGAHVHGATSSLHAGQDTTEASPRSRQLGELAPVTGGRGEGTRFLIAGMLPKYAKIALSSASEKFWYTPTGIGGKIGLP